MKIRSYLNPIHSNIFYNYIKENIQMQNLNLCEEFISVDSKEFNPYEGMSDEDIKTHKEKWKEFNIEQNYNAGKSLIEAQKIILTD